MHWQAGRPPGAAAAAAACSLDALWKNACAAPRRWLQGRRHRGKASLLYTFQEAADIDADTIYRIGLEGERLWPCCRYSVGSCTLGPPALCRLPRAPHAACAA